MDQVCVGQREKLLIFGDDYDTPERRHGSAQLHPRRRPREGSRRGAGQAVRRRRQVQGVQNFLGTGGQGGVSARMGRGGDGRASRMRSRGATRHAGSRGELWPGR